MMGLRRRTLAILVVLFVVLPVVEIILLVQLGQLIGLLPVLGRQVAGAVGCLVLFGLGFGVSSIATPAILLDRYGATGFGTIAGMLGTPTTIAKAAGPLAGAGFAEAFGYRPLIIAVAVACAVAATALALTRRLLPTTPEPTPEPTPGPTRS